jgi:hypothetical protein
MRQQAVDLVRQRVEIGEVHQPDRAAADLVLVSRADAAPGGADHVAVAGFADRVEVAVQRQDQRDVFGDAQIFRTDRNALRLQLCHLIEERLRIEHHAIADHREFGRPQHARRQQRELVGDAVDDQGMAGIVATLEAHNDVGLLRQPVDDLALPFVAPLGADDDNIGHFAGIPSATLIVQTRCLRKTCADPRSRACFSGSGAQPQSRPGPLACEAPHRIKEAG